MTTSSFRCIVADPPWREQGAGRSKRGADRHYQLLGRRQILNVMLGAPVWNPDPTGCHLWLWATSNHLPSAFWLMAELGFRYVTFAVWVKLGKIGLGQYLRHRHEPLLLGRMGETMLPQRDKCPSSVVEAPRRGHSVKPDEAFKMIEAVSPGPRLEMFARRDRAGWDCWGDELEP